MKLQQLENFEKWFDSTAFTSLMYKINVYIYKALNKFQKIRAVELPVLESDKLNSTCEGVPLDSNVKTLLKDTPANKKYK